MKDCSLLKLGDDESPVSDTREVSEFGIGIPIPQVSADTRYLRYRNAQHYSLLKPVTFNRFHPSSCASPQPACADNIFEAALNMLSRCHAVGYKHDGIIIIAIHPGWVKTDLGGDQAPLTKEGSVGGMMKIITTLSEKNNGTFVDWTGKIIPW
ncbi:unnamed protein product [Ranitomeya imitator]|uniref:Uncharacterized protein n=1 Tax=Ranitomeya imitator TaxID=111125 RepID=A0ABN9LQI0_9NEOB|nr:unnamed protein product [Ranitomeya imitator]